jgi:hypothetical protein
VLNHFQIPSSPDSIFSTLPAEKISDTNAEFDNWTQREELIVSPESKGQLLTIQAAALTCLVGLGFYKIGAAAFHGRNNVLFLILSLVVAAAALLLVGRASRLTQRGKQYLKDMQTAHAGVRLAVRSPDESELATEGAFGSSLPVAAMGLFGIAALESAGFEDLRQHYQKSASASSGCGAASSGCGAASACGGSSGGDGGGSGCGGGGCGGCGGS